MILDATSQTLVVLGAAFTLLAGIGVLRFGDVLARLHAVAKASVLGMLLVIIGAALGMDNADDITSLALAAVLQLLTLPVGVNLISRAAYRMGDGPQMDTVDELAEADGRWGRVPEDD